MAIQVVIRIVNFQVIKTTGTRLATIIFWKN